MLKKQSWIKGLLFLGALELVAISINFFFGPLNIAAGGSTGISILVEAVWGVNRSLTVLVVNILMIILAAIFLGKQTVRNVALGSFLVPILMAVTPSFAITNNKLLAMTFGGVLMGGALSLLYRLNASSGGTTIPPMILKKYFYLNQNTTLFIIDFSIIVLNIFVDGWEGFLLATYAQIITTLTMNYTEAGLDRKYQVRVMSDEYFDQIKEMIMRENHDLTFQTVTGGYSNDKKQQLFVVVDPKDYGSLISKIHQIDKNAFLIIDTVVRVHGGKWGLN